MGDTTEVIYPPELSPKVTCGKCGGSGERPDKPGRGLRWAMPDCSTCKGKGELDRKHYAYCKRRECVGCLPTIDEITQMPLLDVFAQMLARCIPQSPDTKTHEGAVAIIRQFDGWYHSTAYFARLHTFAEDDAKALREALNDVFTAYDRFVGDDANYRNNLYALSLHCDANSVARRTLDGLSSA